MKVGIWPFDGVDLIYLEPGEDAKLTGLNFDTMKDARWARKVFADFLRCRRARRKR